MVQVGVHITHLAVALGQLKLGHLIFRIHLIYSTSVFVSTEIP
jgi:hypothetical protein